MNALEIIQNIQQVMSKSHDGAIDEKGKPVKIGLKREKGHPINDSRVMDGFKIRFEGPYLGIIYQSEFNIKEMHENNFEDNIEYMFSNISNFIKKEYKKNTKKNLNLKPVGECQIEARILNGHKNWVECYKRYKIGNIKFEETPKQKQKTLNENDYFRNFMLEFNKDKK